MAFLGVFVFAGVGGESVGLEVNSDSFYNDTNLADGWIYSANLDDDFLDDVNSHRDGKAIGHRFGCRLFKRSRNYSAFR